MKHVLNSIFSISGSHFKSCPSVAVRFRIAQPGYKSACTCEERCYRLTLAIGLSMFAMEIIGGFLTNSLSLLGDSFHLLADSGALVVGIVTAKMIKKSEGKEKLFRKRAVFINGTLLLSVCGYLLYESFMKMLHPSLTIGISMTIVAAIGIGGNALQHYVLMSVTGDKPKNDMVRSSIILHVFSDLLQSFALVAGGIGIIFIADQKVASMIDPFLSTGIGFVMAIYAANLIIKSFSKQNDDHHEHGHHCSHHH